MAFTDDELRKKALDYIAKHQIDISEWGTDIHRLIEELSIHQIELETQNNELLLAQDESKKLTDELNNLFENAPVGYVIIDNNENIIRANRAFCSLVGTDVDDLRGSNFSHLVSSIFQDNFYHFFQLLKKKQIAAFIEIKLHCKHKREQYVRIDGTSLNDTSTYRMSVIDISQQKELENRLRFEGEKLHRSETMFRQIIERSSDIFFYQNTHTRMIEYISPNIEKILGYTVNDCLRSSVLKQMEIILPKFRAIYTNLLVDLISADEQGETSIFREFQVYNKKKQTKWMQASFSLVKDENLEAKQIIGCLHDISKDKKYETELITSKGKAEQSDILKSAFLANMSHEIRTPLNAIIGFSELICDTESEEEKKEYNSIISSNGEVLLNLINDILDLSKIEAGYIDLNNTEFNLSELFRHIETTFKARMTENVKLVCNIPTSDCYVYLDKNRVNQLMINFISNAIKFTPAGKIEIGFEISENGVKLYVADSGIGISEENQKKVFDRFLKFNSHIKGTGLGLSICKTIVNFMGGDVGVSSCIGKGSTFWASIPCTCKENPNTENQTSNHNSTIVAQHNILVVEDNDSNYRLIEIILSKTNHLIWAKNGLEGVEMAAKFQPDLILMDIQMPVMNGLDATRAIRENNKNVPIIAVTANAFSSDSKMAIDAGCNGYLIKPLNRQRLMKELNNYLQAVK